MTEVEMLDKKELLEYVNNLIQTEKRLIANTLRSYAGDEFSKGYLHALDRVESKILMWNKNSD